MLCDAQMLSAVDYNTGNYEEPVKTHLGIFVLYRLTIVGKLGHSKMGHGELGRGKIGRGEMSRRKNWPR